MIASSEIRKAYISLIGNVTGLQGFDTEIPITLYNEDIKEYFTVTHLTSTDSEYAKGSNKDNMAFREATPIVTMQVQVFQVNEIGFVSNVAVENYASQIEDAIKRNLSVDGWSVYETTLDDIRPMNVGGIQRLILNFQHRVQRKRIPASVRTIDANPIPADYEKIYDAN